LKKPQLVAETIQTGNEIYDWLVAVVPAPVIAPHSKIILGTCLFHTRQCVVLLTSFNHGTLWTKACPSGDAEGISAVVPQPDPKVSQLRADFQGVACHG
jgi:hypothetical protein